VATKSAGRLTIGRYNKNPFFKNTQCNLFMSSIKNLILKKLKNIIKERMKNEN
jgi:hypothetical protein